MQSICQFKQAVFIKRLDWGPVTAAMMLGAFEYGRRVVTRREVQIENRAWPRRDVIRRAMHDVAMANQYRAGRSGLRCDAPVLGQFR